MFMETFDLKEVCRLCLSKGHSLTKIFPENESTDTTVGLSSLAQRIMTCVGIEVEPAENLPNQICNVCIDQLERWEHFKKLCECSNEELITGMPPLSDEVLEKNLQKNSNNLETSSDFGLGDVSLLEHDSLFDSIDGSRDEYAVDTGLNILKSTTSVLKENIEGVSSTNLRGEQLRTNVQQTTVKEDTKNKRIEKKSSCYKRYTCELCSTVFKRFSFLLQHDRVEHREIAMTEVCSKCGRLFISKQRLDIHNQMKHRDKLYECGVCGLKCVSEKSLEVHKKRHSGRFVCDVCGLATSTNRSLQDHKVRHLNDKERPLYICNICQHQFKNQQTLTEHLHKHTSDVPEWKCRLCNKTFMNQRSLSIHESTHSTEMLAVCDECGVVFKNQTTLNIHKLNHKEKQHTCLICDKMFTTKNLMIRHMSIHSGRTYDCSVCNKPFSRNDTLMLHLKTHQKPQSSCLYTCCHCGKQFSFLRYLKRHLARIHKDKQTVDTTKCNDINKEFT